MLSMMLRLKVDPNSMLSKESFSEREEYELQGFKKIECFSSLGGGVPSWRRAGRQFRHFRAGSA
jgi:hypothetical protein